MGRYLLLLTFFCCWQSGQAFHSSPDTYNHLSSSTNKIELGGILCPAPAWTATSNVTATSAMFSWSSVPEAESYIVQTRTPGGAWIVVPGSPYTSTTVTVNGFAPATTYEWRVQTNCVNGENSIWTDPASFTTMGNGSGCEVPGSLQTLNITQSSATWDWAPANGAINYSVQWRNPGGQWAFLSGGPWANSGLFISGLAPATTYEWRVRSNCANGEFSAWSTETVFTTLGYSCPTPNGTNTTNITSTTATFNWNAVTGAEHYLVQIRLSNGTWVNIPGNPFTATTADVTGLMPYTSYMWRVQAFCGGSDYSHWSASVWFTTTGNGDCQAPDWLSTFNITQTTATWDWSTVPGAWYYSVEWRYPGGQWNTLAGGPWSSTILNVGSLQPGTTYEWRVKSHCGNGLFSDWSYPTTFTTLGYSCQKPYWTSTDQITDHSALLSWSDVPGAQSYSVQYRLMNGSWTYVNGSPFAGTSVTLSGLYAGTSYEWRVRANCGYGNYSYWTNPVWFTTTGSGGGSCQPPDWLSTYNVTTTTATWDWSNVSGAVSYSVQWRYAGGTWNNLSGGPWSYTLLNVGGLQPSTTYEWRVRSNCANGGVSDWSIPDAFTTQGYGCGMPSNLYTNNITNTSANLNWSAVSGAQNYSVQYRLPNGYWTYVPGSPFNSTSTILNGLQSGTTYEWRVRANCSNGQYGYWTWPESFTTNGSGSCYPPSWLYTINITQTSATLDWTSASGAETYDVQWRQYGGAWNTLSGGPFSNTIAYLTGLQPGGSYEWRVRSNCYSGYTSEWSTIAYFTTNSGSGNSNNDNCENATPLTVNSSCVSTTGTNTNSSPSQPPPFGNCYAGSYKDVWFSFTMPNVSNPQVTIRTTAGSLTDAVMEVYVGNTCANMSYVTCEDDNSNGNGSTMPVINLTGSPNAKVWVRIWGYNGTSGSFQICVFDYISNNLEGGDNENPVIILNEDIIQSEIEITPDANAAVDAPLPVLQEMMLMPNPATDFVMVQLPVSKGCEVNRVDVLDLSGKSHMQQAVSTSDVQRFETQLDVSGLPQGMYLVRLETACGVQTKRLVIAR